MLRLAQYFLGLLSSFQRANCIPLLLGRRLLSETRLRSQGAKFSSFFRRSSVQLRLRNPNGFQLANPTQPARQTQPEGVGTAYLRIKSSGVNNRLSLFAPTQYLRAIQAG